MISYVLSGSQMLLDAHTSDAYAVDPRTRARVRKEARKVARKLGTSVEIVNPFVPEPEQIMDRVQPTRPRSQAARDRKVVAWSLGPEARARVEEMSARTGEPMVRVVERLIMTAPMPLRR